MAKRVYWVVYPAAQSAPAGADIVAETVSGAVAYGNDTAPSSATTGFRGDWITGLTPSTPYRLASVGWEDGVLQDVNVSDVKTTAATDEITLSGAVTTPGPTVVGSITVDNDPGIITATMAVSIDATSTAVGSIEDADTPTEDPPNLSGASAEPAQTSVEISVITDETGGTMYAAVYPAGTVITDPNDIINGVGALGDGVVSAASTITNVPQTIGTVTGLSTVTGYVAWIAHRDADSDDATPISTTFITLAAPDTTAPSLSNLQTTDVTFESVSATVVTDETGGTIYFGVYAEGASPSDEDVIAGTGAAATTTAVAAAGTVTMPTIDNLSSATAYTLYSVHRDSAGNKSALLSAAFTTETVYTGEPPVLSSAQAVVDGSRVNLSVQSTKASGTLYVGLYPANEAPTNPDIIAGTGAIVRGQQAAVVGLNELETLYGAQTGTPYKAWFVQIDANQNQSLSTSVAFKASSLEVPDPEPVEALQSDSCTLDNLRYKLALRLGFVATGPAATRHKAILEDMLREAQTTIWRQFDEWKIQKETIKYTAEGQRLYDWPYDMDMSKDYAIDVQVSSVWQPVHHGITLEHDTLIANGFTSYPQRYDDRGQIEIYPIPDGVYPLRFTYFRRLLSFENGTDLATMPCDLVFLLAMANAKAHYRHPDADNYASQFDLAMRQLKRARHTGRRYFSSDVSAQEATPIVRPVIVQ